MSSIEDYKVGYKKPPKKYNLSLVNLEIQMEDPKSQILQKHLKKH